MHVPQQFHLEAGQETIIKLVTYIITIQNCVCLSICFLLRIFFMSPITTVDVLFVPHMLRFET